jgi:hypothetical protein
MTMGSWNEIGGSFITFQKIRVMLLVFLLSGLGVLSTSAQTDDILVSGISSPAAANGSYVYQGTHEGRGYWTHSSGAYHIYYSQWESGSSYYWNIDNNLEDEGGAYFYSEEASSIDYPWEVTSWDLDAGTGSAIVAEDNAEPEIAISGNSNDIANGDSSPNHSDHTAFVYAEVTSGSRTRSYTISNAGGADLTIGTITISGAHAGDFSVTTSPAGTVASAGSTGFTITFDPSGEGLRTATVSVSNNDSDENPFTFAVQGEGFVEEDLTLSGISTPSAANGTYVFQGYQYGYPYWKHSSATYYIYNDDYGSENSWYWNIDVNLVDDDGTVGSSTDDDGLFFLVSSAGTPKGLTGWTVMDNFAANAGTPVIAAAASAPEIDIIGNTVSITANDSSPAIMDHTHFGSLDIASGSRTRTYTIANTGDASLSLSGSSPYVLINGTASADFSVTTPPSGTIVAGGSTTFTVTFDASAKGAREASLTIESNDSNESIYTFSILGDGFVPDNIQLSGVTNPSDANGVYVHQGLLNEFQYWMYDTGSESYYIYNDEYQDSWYWNIDRNTVDDDGVVDSTSDDDFLFFSPESLAASPVQLTGWSTNSAAGYHSGGVPVFGDREMIVLGNSIEILDGDPAASEFDHTDFGSTNVASGSLSRMFEIANSGELDLNLTDASPYVSISGDAAADFTVTVAPLATISGNSTSSFTIVFDPSVAGTREATVSITNDDSDENPYTFVIEGEGIGGLPVLATTTVTTFGITSATMGGNVTANGGVSVTEKGVIYSSTDSTPTIDEAGVIQNSNGSGTGAFSESIGGLTADTLYYVQAYAINSVGTNYGGAVSFTTDPKQDQIISNFLAVDGSTFFTTDQVDLSASASSGLTVSFTNGSGSVTWADVDTISFPSHGTVQLVASQVGNGSYNAAISVTNEYTVHGVPSVGDVSFSYTTGQVFKMHSSQLLADTTDPEGSAFGISSVAGLSASNYTVSATGDWIYYSPPVGFAEDDTFTFSVTNTFGGSSSGTVTLQAQGAAGTAQYALNIVSIEQSGDDMICRFAGIPGRIFDIEATSSLEEPISWTFLGTVTFDSTGQGEFTETDAPATRYYRLKKEGE